MKIKTKNITLTLAGIVIFILGGLGLKLEWFTNFTSIPYIMIGIGAGLFGLGLGEIIKIRTLNTSPTAKRKYEIEQNDERNIEINQRSKSKAFDFMGYVYPVVMLVCVLLNVELTIILLLVAVYLLIYAVQIYYFVKYQKDL